MYRCMCRSDRVDVDVNVEVDVDVHYITTQIQYT